MAAPAYSTDLITINTADGTDGQSVTGWSETAGHITGANAIGDGDTVIQGVTSVSKASGNATGVQAGMCYDSAGNNIRADAAWVDGQSVIFYWWIAITPVALESFDFGPTTGVAGDTGATISGGFLLGVGNAEANQRYFKVGGNDKYIGPFGGWQNTAVEPVNTTVAYTDGSPTAVYDVWSCLPVLRQTVRRGQTMAMDVLRWGPRGKITVAGGTSPDSPATLVRVAEFDSRDDTSADSQFTLLDSGRHRLGIFQQREGFILWKGQIEVTGRLTDQGLSVILQDNPTVYDNFTEVVVNGGECNLTNIAFVAQAKSPRQGRFSTTGGSPTLNLEGCNFNGCSTFAATSYLGNTFTECLEVTANGGTFKNNKFNDAEGTEAVTVTSGQASTILTGDFSGNEFTRASGTINAVAVSGVSGTSSITWDNNSLTGYGTGVTGTNVSSTAGGAIKVTFSGNGTLTISVVNGADIPTVEIVTGGFTVQVDIISSVAVSITGLLGNTEVSVLENPSPYTQTLAEQQAGAGPVSLFNEDFVSAVTGTDILVDTESGANVTRITSTTTDFTDMTGLVAGDFIRVTERVSGQNLRTFDTFEVVSVATNTIDVVDVASSTLVQQNIIDTTGDTITVEKIDASYNFSVASGEVVDILLFRVGSLPILLLNQTISSTNNSFPVSQSLDRNFEV